MINASIFVNAFDLKTPRRVKTLGYLILFAVMIASLLELRMSNAINPAKTTISAGSRKKVQRPTALLSLNMLNGILVIYLNSSERIKRPFPGALRLETRI